MAKALSSRIPPPDVLLDERGYTARLRLTPGLPGEPIEPAAQERDRVARLWQALQADPFQAAGDRAELDKLDRAIVATRKQVVLAQNQISSLQGELAQARTERFANPAVYSLGALALAAAGAWLYQRRQMQEHRSEPETQLSPVPASPAAFPPAVEPSGVSQFDESDLGVAGDEADQWIERARVALPSVQ